MGASGSGHRLDDALDVVGAVRADVAFRLHDGGGGVVGVEDVHRGHRAVIVVPAGLLAGHVVVRIVDSRLAVGEAGNDHRTGKEAPPCVAGAIALLGRTIHDGVHAEALHLVLGVIRQIVAEIGRLVLHIAPAVGHRTVGPAGAGVVDPAVRGRDFRLDRYVHGVQHRAGGNLAVRGGVDVVGAERGAHGDVAHVHRRALQLYERLGIGHGHVGLEGLQVHSDVGQIPDIRWKVVVIVARRHPVLQLRREVSETNGLRELGHVGWGGGAVIG